MKNKLFDCVQMKWEIQQKLSARYSGLKDDEAHRRQMEKVKKNTLLGPFLEKVRALKTGPDRKKL